MEDLPRRRPLASRLRGVGAALVAVVLVGFLVRSPVTVPEPTVPATATEATSEEVPAPRGPEEPPADERRMTGVWTTVGTRPPISPLRPGPGVWTGEELLVGFSPAVAAFSPDPRPGQAWRSDEAWRSLPPHPAGALQVRGAVQAPDGPVLVYGQKTCAGCPWEPALHALDPVGQTWERLPDAPGGSAQDTEVVLEVAGQLVVVRDRGASGVEVLAYDPVDAAWRDLGAPAIGPLRWQAVAAGDHLVIVGVLVDAAGIEVAGAMAHDLPAGAWRDVSEAIPLPRPHETAAVWTGEEVIFFGGSVRDGAPRGAALSLREETWTALPDLPFGDQLMPGLGGDGPLTGLMGAWDGERALFAGGLIVPLFLAWSPDPGSWEVRRATVARAGGTAVWTGRQLLIWGGSDRRGPIVDLQAWPVRPVDS